MTHTIEDALEILAGIASRAVNIRIDFGELNLVKSLARQVSRGTALTDRQFDLATKKIEKYRIGLEQNSVDVSSLLALKTLRMPLRQIDRSQSVSLFMDPENKVKLLVKYVFSKKFSAVWSELQEQLTASILDTKGEKQLGFNEQDLYLIVNTLRPLGFTVSNDVEALYKKIEEIYLEPNNFVPHVDIVDNEPVLKNVNVRCKDYLDKEVPSRKGSDFLVFLDRVKNCGISHKNPKIFEKIAEITPNNLIKSILVSTETRFRLNPEEHTMDSLFDILDTLNQWPLLVIVDETKDAISQARAMCNTLMQRCNAGEVTVFFRLENGNPEHEEFNQFVKDNHLNNYIDSKTKVVFVSKNRIPKPLFNADWTPRSALVTSAYEYGKTSAYLNDFPTVYYYNNSVSVRHGRLKGTRQIVQL